MNRLIAIMLLIGSNILLAEVPEYIKNCMDCHGENGVSTESDMPTISGASSEFIEMAMFTYKDELRPAAQSKYRRGDTERESTDMKKIADALSDEQIKALADFFASKPFVAAKQEFDASLVNSGKKVHDKKCKKCHEDGGSSSEDDSGILAGQWTPYLRQSMKEFRDGSREMEKKKKKRINKLSEKEWEALLAFYASQQN